MKIEDESYENKKLNLEDLPIFDFHEPTPEELAKAKEKRAIELEKKGFLPENEGYSETMTSPQEMVEKNPTQFIIEECIPACKELWSKNIYTFMVSDHLNEGECWIEIIEDSLSDENKEIYMNLYDEDIVKFSYHKGSVNFGVKAVGKDGQQKLLELAKMFKMQDVPKKQAYISIQDFLINYCGCYEEIKNLDYRYLKPYWELELEPDKLKEYIEKYDEWQNSNESKEYIRKFDSSKVIKSLPEYAQEHGMIVDDDRVYLSKFHYEKHKKFIEYESNLELQSIGENFKR